MNQNILSTIEQQFIKKMPEFTVGDTIAVSTIVREGDKKRVQIFKGIVLAMHGSGTRKTFTVRKISYGIGVEKIFPLYSPNIGSIKLLKRGQVRMSNIGYMRKRVGKKALKVKEGELVIPEEGEVVEAEALKQPAAEKNEETKAEKPAAKAGKQEKAAEKEENGKQSA